MDFFVSVDSILSGRPRVVGEDDVFRRRLSRSDLIFLGDFACKCVAEEHFEYLWFDTDFFEGGDLVEA